MIKGFYKKLLSLLSAAEVNAAQAWKSEGGNAEHAFWMYATPVNMQLGRDSYFLTDPASTPISSDESLVLIDSLNTHFSGMGYYFYLVNDVWFLGLDQTPDITTTQIDLVKNQNVASYLPQGNGALAWNKLQNEIQMLMFNHPVNQVREAQGLPIINSLWCYGLGAA